MIQKYNDPMNNDYQINHDLITTINYHDHN